MLLSTLSFAVMNVFIKKVSDFPAMEVVFFRCLISMFICFAIIYRQKADWKGTNHLFLIARGIFGTIALYTFFITLHQMPLGTAVTIQYLSPIFTTVIAIFFLKEKVRPLQWLFFLISFSGILVIKGFDSRISLGILLIGISSALASGFAYNMVRSLRQKENLMVVVLHFQLVGVVAGFIFSIFNWRTPKGIEWFYLLMIGICTQMGQVSLTKALNREKMANISIFNYLGIIYALLFGFIFFDEKYGWYAFSGILLVIGGVVMNYIYQRLGNLDIPEEELTTIEE